MLRLAGRLSIRSGREAFIRLLLTAGAVAIGVTVLLSLLAEYHGFQATSGRPSWESTTGVPPAPAGAPPNSELWNFSENIYRGRFIEQLDVATLGPQAPVLPGLPSMPGAGQFYASPALIDLLRTVPNDQLGNRFPAGRLIGTIGYPAIDGPNSLAIVIGHAPAELASRPNTVQVDHIVAAPHAQGTTNLYRLAFGLGAIALLLPVLVLIGTATRLAAARREERYAAIRLVGSTPRQISVIASVDAAAGSLLGALLGIGVFLAIQPALANLALSGARFFPETVTPTLVGYVGVLVGVPLASIAAALWSLRRVRISPLGVSRRVTPSAPGVWRVVPIALGVPLFLVPLSSNPHNPSLLPVMVGLVLIMVGLVLAGSWFTMQAARLLARLTGGASSLLASRRLADNPKAAFRSVSGLVLAVFVGTLIGGVAPASISAQSGGRYDELTNVLRMPYLLGPGGQSQADPTGAALISTLSTYPGVTVIPVYSNPDVASFKFGPPPPGAAPSGGPAPGGPPADPDVVSCTSLKALPVLGACGAGRAAVSTDIGSLLFTDNPRVINRNLPVITPSSPAVAADLSHLPLSALLVKADSAAALERARTFLTVNNRPLLMGGDNLGSWQQGSVQAESFGELARIRNNPANNIDRVVLVAVALTILVAGCSLAVSLGGSLVERQRPFSLLRLTGTPVRALYRAVVLESVLPLFTAALVAAGVAFGLLVPLVKALSSPGAHGASLGPPYYLAMGSGLAVALGVILLTLPLLGRITQPHNARFE